MNLNTSSTSQIFQTSVSLFANKFGLNGDRLASEITMVGDRHQPTQVF